MVSSFAKSLAAVVLAAAASSAGASAGNGIRLGGSEGRVHPFFDVEARYDSNVSYTLNDEAVADVILHFRPGMELKLPGDLAALEFSGAIDWAQYLGMSAPDPGREDTSSLSRMYGEARIAALLARRSPVSVRIDNEFRRHISAALNAGASAVVANTNVLTVSIPWTPGGGALVLAANGSWLLETFEKYQDEALALRYGDLGYSHFRGGAELQWRFLPRTTAVFEAAYFTRVPSADGSANEASGIEITSGLTGLLTQRISATVKLGYGSSSAPAARAGGILGGLPAKDSQTVLGDVSFDWLAMDTLSFQAGYARAFGVDPSASVYVGDGFSFGGRLKMADRFAFRAGVRYDRLAFQAIPNADTAFLRVDPTIEGNIGRWLNVGLGYVYSSRTASWPVGTPPPDYSKNEAFLKLGVTY